MLKVKMGIHELYSHWMQEEDEWDLEELLAFISDREIKSFDALIAQIESDLVGQYKGGLLELNGRTGDGSWYDGNDDDGHDQLRVEFDYPKDLEAKLKPYFTM